MLVPDALPPAARRVADRLHAADRDERARGVREPGSLMAVSPEVAHLLHALVLRHAARSSPGGPTVVEFGTSHGYSTLHLADAARRTGGRVHTVDHLAEKTRIAAANLAEAGLADHVTLVTDEGTSFADSLPDPLDFVLVDYPLPAFEPAWPAVRRRLAPGATVFFDGGPRDHWRRGAAADVLAKLSADPELVVTLLPMTKEHLLAVRARD